MSAAPALPPRAPRQPRVAASNPAAAHAGAGRGGPARAAASPVSPPRSSSPARPAPRSIPPRPLLTVVKAPAQQRAKGPFVIGCISILGASLLGTLLLNTAMAADAYTLRTLQAQVAELAIQTQDLTDQLQAVSSPANLAAAAAAIGMVEVDRPVFIRLADHTIVGGE